MEMTRKTLSLVQMMILLSGKRWKDVQNEGRKSLLGKNISTNILQIKVVQETLL